MTPSRLEQLENELRDAAQYRRYREVTRLSSEFAEAVRAYAQTLPKGDRRAAAAGRKLDGVLAWALVLMHAARANCLAELRRVTMANRYTHPCGEPGRTAAIHLDA
jgi:hypothetical protein